MKLFLFNNKDNYKTLVTKPVSGQGISEQREIAKAWLDSVSPSMCLAKWFQVSMHLTNGRTHSCYHPPTHEISREEILIRPSALHNTTKKKIERREMLNGKRPAGCQYCWSIEDAPGAPAGGHRSDRHYRSGEFWAEPFKDLTLSRPWDFDFTPTYVEVNFNQACNFKCSYCSPHLSSEWAKEIEQHGAYPTTIKHNNIEALAAQGMMPIGGSNSENPYVVAFWKWWPTLYNSLKVFRMTGGEPMIDANTYKVLRYVRDNPKSDLEIAITTNLCPPNQDVFDRFLNAVKEIQDKERKIEVVAVSDPSTSTYQDWPKKVIDKPSHDLEILRKFELENCESAERKDFEDWYDFELDQKKIKTDSFVYSFTYPKEACKHIALFVSLDSVGKKAEYIRTGLVFDRLVENAKRILLETQMTNIYFINTFNLFSVTSISEYLYFILSLRKYVSSFQFIPEKNIGKKSYWNRQRVWFDLPILRAPAWQSIKILPDNYLSYLEAAVRLMEENHNSKVGDLVGFYDFEIDKLKRNIGYMKDALAHTKDDIKTNRKDFFSFFEEHDRRRGTSYRATFPEMDDFFKLCERSSTANAKQ